MKNYQLIAAFELEINKLDNALQKPVTDDSLFWINQAIVKFVKERFNGNPPKRTSYEQNEKRTRDLNRLFKEVSYPTPEAVEHSSYDSYEYTYPEDMMYVLNEDVQIDGPGGTMDTCVFECTADSFMYRINNSLTDFHYKYHKARPLRIRFDNGCELLTDKNYKISSYILGYLKKPTELTLNTPQGEYSDFNDHVMYEIIKMAA